MSILSYDGLHFQMFIIIIRFINHECALFKYRLDRLNETERSEFMAANGLFYDVVPTDVKESRKKKLMDAGGDTMNESLFYSTVFYK